MKHVVTDIDRTPLTDPRVAGLDHARAALDELARLVEEASDRIGKGRYLEALASLTALEPAKNYLVTELFDCWRNGSIELADGARVGTTDGGYL